MLLTILDIRIKITINIKWFNIKQHVQKFSETQFAKVYTFVAATRLRATKCRKSALRERTRRRRGEHWPTAQT